MPWSAEATLARGDPIIDPVSPKPAEAIGAALEKPTKEERAATRIVEARILMN
jgi:hypothetical protein